MGLEALKRSAIALAVAAGAFAAAPAQAAVVTIDVGGILSNGEFGDALNEVLSVSVGAWQNVVKLSWDVELLADNPSWLSEMSVDIAGGNGGGVTLTPGFDANQSGTGSFAGSFDLLVAGLSFHSGGSGNLRLEFFEQFDDFTGAPPNDHWDGIWLAGSISIETVPEPASYGLMGVALLGAAVASRRRRRESQPTA